MPDYKPLLLRWGWVIAACSLLGASGAWIASANMPALFRARHTISVVPADMDWRIRDLTKELAFNSTARFPQPNLVAQVQTATGLPVADIAPALRATFDNVTLLVTIEALHPRADMAGVLASAATEAYFAAQTAYFREQEFTGSIDFARVSASPEIQRLAPNVLSNTMAGFVLGLALGVALLLWLLWLEEERMVRPEVAGRTLELPVLGQITVD